MFLSPRESFSIIFPTINKVSQKKSTNDFILKTLCLCGVEVAQCDSLAWARKPETFGRVSDFSEFSIANQSSSPPRHRRGIKYHVKIWKKISRGARSPLTCNLTKFENKMGKRHTEKRKWKKESLLILLSSRAPVSFGDENEKTTWKISYTCWWTFCDENEMSWKIIKKLWIIWKFFFLIFNFHSCVVTTISSQIYRWRIDAARKVKKRNRKRTHDRIEQEPRTVEWKKSKNLCSSRWMDWK